MNIDTTIFKNIGSTATNSYGIIKADSLGSLVLNSITATGITNKVSDTAPLGGGRFLYINQPTTSFNLEIKGTSTYQCSTTPDTMGSTDQTNIATGKYTSGSLFDLTSDLMPFSVSVSNAVFKNCYTAL